MMKRMMARLLEPVSVLALLVVPSTASATTMSYSVYNSVAGSSPSVVGYSRLDDLSGCLSGGPVQSTRIKSPTRQAVASSNSVALSFNGEVGNWSVEGTFTMNCNCAPYGGGHSLTVFGKYDWWLSIKDTYYTGQYGTAPFCKWKTLACSTGTPTCKDGVGLKVDPGCTNYSHAEWLVALRGAVRQCLFSAVQNATGPGPCN
jgi:hypothetical protein